MGDKLEILVQKAEKSTVSEKEEAVTQRALRQEPSSATREEFLRMLEMKPQEKTGSSSQEQGARPEIPMVPESLREQNKDCYDPTVVSIGPYHHNKPKLQEMEKIKVTMAREFIAGSGKNVQSLYDKVAKAAKDAKKWYVEESVREFDDDKFIQMMFLDGCFILQFIIVSMFRLDNLEMDRGLVVSVKRDLILLENQLPFQVLKELLSWRLGEEHQREISAFFRWHFHQRGLSMIEEFLWYSIRGLPYQKQEWNRVIKNFLCRFIQRRPHTSFPFALSDQEKSQATHLIDEFRMLFIRKQPNHRGKPPLYRYRPVRELKRLGINFKPSRTNFFTDIKFRSKLFGGTLKLPPIIVDQSTKALLLNLVAYESCSKAPEDREVTSYVCFMDSLIDNVEDVAELRSKGIILNFLSDDKEVAELFNKIAHNLVPNHDDYAKVKMDIESYYSSSMKKFLVGWWKFYFDSPWYFLAYAGGIVVIILTAIQTYLAAFPPCGR